MKIFYCRYMKPVISQLSGCVCVCVRICVCVCFVFVELPGRGLNMKAKLSNLSMAKYKAKLPFFFPFLCLHLDLSQYLRKKERYNLTTGELIVWKKKKTLMNFVSAARYYQRFKKQICQPRRELSGNSINVCVGLLFS